VVGKSDAKGKEALSIRGFYSWRIERGLAAGPHVGFDGRRRGSSIGGWPGARVPYPGVTDRWGCG
jgi:hypothetical protein